MLDRDTNIPSTSLRGNISSIIDATLEGMRFVVTRNGKPRMAIVPLEDLERLRAIEDADDRRAIAQRRSEPLVAWEQVKKKLGLKSTPTRPPRSPRSPRTPQARKAVRRRRP